MSVADVLTGLLFIVAVLNPASATVAIVAASADALLRIIRLLLGMVERHSEDDSEDDGSRE